MTDIEIKLLKNEQIIYHGHKHWIIFFPSVALLIICFSFFIEVVLLQKLVIVPLLLAIITGIGAMISYFLSEIVITNKKVLLKVGYLRRIFVCS